MSRAFHNEEHRLDMIDPRETQRRRIILDSEVSVGRLTEREAYNLSIIAMLVSQSTRDDIYWTERAYDSVRARWLQAVDDVQALHYAVRQCYSRIDELEEENRFLTSLSEERLERILRLEESILDCPSHPLMSTPVSRALDFDSDSDDSQVTVSDTLSVLFEEEV